MLNTMSFFTRLWEVNSVSPSAVLLSMVGALVIGFLISLVYMYTHRKDGFSQSYIMTMMMLPPLVATIVVTMAVASATTATAISLTGAFSLVRFRSAPGDPKDIAYIFFAMTMGVICGLGYIGYAFVFFAILAFILIVCHVTAFAAPATQDMTLKITIPENLNFNGLFDKVLDQNTTSWKLKRVKTTDFGTLFDLVYSVRVKTDIDQKKFIDDIRTLNGNLNVTLVLYKYDDKIYEK